MERLSVFDIFKIGVGPSSSHTLGPWKAALDFVHFLGEEVCQEVFAIEIRLFGSLSKTGRGHGTDIAVILGLMGYDPVVIDTRKITPIFDRIKSDNKLSLYQNEILFNPDVHIIFEDVRHDYHPNTLTFIARLKDESTIESTYFSVGGGFIEKEGDSFSIGTDVELPFPIDKAKELRDYSDKAGKSISEIVYENEKAFRGEGEIKEKICSIYNTMLACVHKGCHTEGVLPGGLFVTRRAKAMTNGLMAENESFRDPVNWLNEIKNQDHAFNIVSRWVSCFALAVNEENAAFGRVVTSPTNGAAGVIPAVLLYYLSFCEEAKESDIQKFILTSGEIGSLFKKGATISAAVGGCQAEIGVSSAMAAAGLTEVLGGSPAQALMAAEIAMEHHLGMTCDPIGGLVQIPCIERNAMGAMKAITASTIALASDADRAIVSLDDVIKTMWETSLDMNTKYKETAEGGLAINLSVIQPSC